MSCLISYSRSKKITSSSSSYRGLQELSGEFYDIETDQRNIYCQDLLHVKTIPKSLDRGLLLVLSLFHPNTKHHNCDGTGSIIRETQTDGVTHCILGRQAYRPEIDCMHDDVTCPEREYGSCSHAQIQDGRQ